MFQESVRPIRCRIIRVLNDFKIIEIEDKDQEGGIFASFMTILQTSYSG